MDLGVWPPGTARDRAGHEGDIPNRGPRDAPCEYFSFAESCFLRRVF